MKHIMMLTIVALFGCAPQADKICETDVVGLAMGFEQLDCLRLDYDLRLARHIMIEEGKMTKEEWNAKFQPYTVIVLDEVNIPNPYGVGDDVCGYVNPVSQEMYLNRWLLCLMHESFHVKNGIAKFHEGWSTNGTQDIIDIYEKDEYMGDSEEFRKRVEHDKNMTKFGYDSYWLPEWYYEEVGWPKQN